MEEYWAAHTGLSGRLENKGGEHLWTVSPMGTVCYLPRPRWTLLDSPVLSASLRSFVSLPPDAKPQGQGFD